MPASTERPRSRKRELLRRKLQLGTLRLSSAERLARLQGDIDRAHDEALRELSPAQRQGAKNIPRPRAVPRVGAGTDTQGQKGVFLGISNRPQAPSGIVGGTVFKVAKTLKLVPGRSTSVGLLAQDPRRSAAGARGVTRHELAHHVLANQGISSGHEAIIAEAAKTVPGEGVNFRLLQSAAEAARTPTREQKARHERQKLNLLRREIRANPRPRTGRRSRPPRQERTVLDVRGLF